MAGPTANEIKTQLKDLLTPVIGTSLTKKAKIIDYLALAFKPGEGEDPTILRSELDPVSLLGGGSMDRVNCLMISEEAFTQNPPPDDSVGISRPRGKNLITRRFRLTYFYQFGQASENIFSTNVEVIRTTVNANPKLGFALVLAGGGDGPGKFIDSHDKIQSPSMYPDAFGDVIVHIADMFLTVRVIEPLG